VLTSRGRHVTPLVDSVNLDIVARLRSFASNLIRASGKENIRIDVVGWVELFAKPTNSAAAMGFVTSSDMRPIWSLYPSCK
jgi:hypothetical protein